MFCPHCGHQQVSNETRFCSRCGFSLDLVVDLVANSSTQLQREKRELRGISLLLAAVIMLLNYFFVFGVVTLPHLANPVFLWIWLLLLVSAFGVCGFGLADLIRGGFFKKLKAREARLSLMKAQQKREIEVDVPRVLDTVTRASIGTAEVPLEPASITETTTRQLEQVPRATKRVQSGLQD